MAMARAVKDQYGVRPTATQSVCDLLYVVPEESTFFVAIRRHGDGNDWRRSSMEWQFHGRVDNIDKIQAGHATAAVVAAPVRTLHLECIATRGIIV